MKALSLARRLEKITFKLEAHHRHLHFTHKALKNQLIPKSLRFKPPGAQPIFTMMYYGPHRQALYAR